MKAGVRHPLTTHSCRGLEDGLYFRIQLYDHFLPFSQFGISLIQLVVDPQAEGLAYKCVEDVGNVLPRKFLRLLPPQGKSLQNLRKHFGIVKHLPNAQSLKLRYGNVLHVLGQHPAPHPSSKVPQVPDSYIVHWWNVDFCLAGQEPVDLPFVGVLGPEGCRRDFSLLWGDWNDLVCLSHCGVLVQVK